MLTANGKTTGLHLLSQRYVIHVSARNYLTIDEMIICHSEPKITGNILNACTCMPKSNSV